MKDIGECPFKLGQMVAKIGDESRNGPVLRIRKVEQFHAIATITKWDISIAGFSGGAEYFTALPVDPWESLARGLNRQALATDRNF